jgi:hypothetical protein
MAMILFGHYMKIVNLGKKVYVHERNFLSSGYVMSKEVHVSFFSKEEAQTVSFRTLILNNILILAKNLSLLFI